MSHLITLSSPLRIFRVLLVASMLLLTSWAFAQDASSPTPSPISPSDAATLPLGQAENTDEGARNLEPMPEAISTALPRLPFAPAERFFFEVSYLGLSVGTLQASVAAEISLEGITTWPLIATATTNPAFILYPVKDRYVSWFDPTTKLSIGNELIANENRVSRRERVRFDRSENKATVRREGGKKPRSEKTHDLPLTGQDLLATFYATRAHPLAIGDVIESPIFTGNRTFTMKATVVGKERLTTKAGTFDTKRVHVEVGFSGKLESKREVRIFFTDDARHIPVRIDAEFFLGMIAADLTSFETGF